MDVLDDPANAPRPSTMGMEVVDAPGLHYIRDLLGTFAIDSLDPVASVSALRDEKATREAASLARKKHLAILSIPFGRNPYVPMEDQRMQIKLFSIGRGLATVPYASYGLFPGAFHPDGRAPIIPSSPLPWPDCYVHTLLPFVVTVSRLHMVPPEARTSISVAECSSIVVANGEDAVRLADELYPKRSIDTPTAASAAGPPPRPQRPPEPRKFSVSAGSSSTTTDETSSSESTGSVVYEEPRVMVIKAEVWLDLSTADEIGSPMEFGEALAPLRAIEAEFAERASIPPPADQTFTENWVQDVAAVDSLAPHTSNNNRPVDAASTIHEDTLTPEDALEHRASAERRHRRAARKARAMVEVDVAPNELSSPPVILPPKKKLRAAVAHSVKLRVRTILRAVVKPFELETYIPWHF